MDQGIKAKWIEALRSGNFLQGRNALTTLKDGKEYDCCLGVLCKVLELPKTVEENIRHPRYLDDRFSFPDITQQKIKMSNDLHDTLVKMNDSGCSFDEIADYLESYTGD